MTIGSEGMMVANERSGKCRFKNTEVSTETLHKIARIKGNTRRVPTFRPLRRTSSGECPCFICVSLSQSQPSCHTYIYAHTWGIEGEGNKAQITGNTMRCDRRRIPVASGKNVIQVEKPVPSTLHYVHKRAGIACEIGGWQTAAHNGCCGTQKRKYGMEGKLHKVNVRSKNALCRHVVEATHASCVCCT